MKITFLCLLCAVFVYGQTIPGRYVVELAGEPAAISIGRQGARPSARDRDFAARRSAVRQGQRDARHGVETLGGRVLDSMDTVVNALIVSIPDARSADLANIPGAVRVHPVRRIRPFLSHALPLHKVPDAWAGLLLGRDGAGAGIKIGMIDTGIDVKNPAFADSLPAVDGFPKVLSDTDRQFTNAKVIVAKNYTTLLPDGGDPDANDRDGHGTGTSLAAAGGSANTPYGPVSGVAPKAYLGNYKVLDANGGTSDVIAKAVDDAVADGMDVLNLSLGSFVASYSDIDSHAVDIAAMQGAVQAGVIVVVAAGNDGPGAGTISDYGSVPDLISVGAIMNDRKVAYRVKTADAAPFAGFPGNAATSTQAISGPLFDVATVDSNGHACAALPPGSAAGAVALVQRGDCFFETKINNAAAAGAVGVLIYNNGGTEFSFSGQNVGGATLPTMFIAAADGAALKKRAAADTMQVTLDFTDTNGVAARTDVVDFSSRGPSVGSALKPDLVAVGEEIVTGAQNSFTDGESYSASGFIDTAGTSFSSPLVAGAAAVLKAARPGLTFQQYRSLLVNGATPATAAPDTAATVSQAGAGALNLRWAVNSTVAAYPTSLNFGTGAGAIHNKLDLTLSNLRLAADTYLIQVAPVGKGPAPAVSDNMVHVDGGASGQVSLTLDGTDLAPGAYQGYVRVTGTTDGNTATIPYWFAVPGSTAAGISVLYQDYVDPARSSAPGAVVFRVVDVAGLPFGGSTIPEVTVNGGGTVRRVYAAGTIPGTYAVDLRAGTSTMEIQIAAGDIVQTVVIGVF